MKIVTEYFSHSAIRRCFLVVVALPRKLEKSSAFLGFENGHLILFSSAARLFSVVNVWPVAIFGWQDVETQGN